MGNNCCSNETSRQEASLENKLKNTPNTFDTLANGLNGKTITLKEFREGIIGRNTLFKGCFGSMVTLYADDTASGRPHKLIEKYISSILPIYANTHSDNSYFPVVISTIYNKSREYLLKAFNASSNHCLLATGTGATGAIFHWQEILSKKFPDSVCLEVRKAEKPLCLVTEYEHHSNILSWEKWGFEVKPIEHTGEDDWEQGLKDLETKIIQNAKRSLISVSISAASNVTSQETPLNKVAALIKRLKTEFKELKGKLVWSTDIAALASHKRINISELDVDAVFISPHKLTGGPGTSGLLFFNLSYYNLEADPTKPGGGTVDGVFGYNSEEIIYTKNINERENAGTPGILQFIRAALTFQLQDLVGLRTIMKREEELRDKMWEAIQRMNDEWETKGNLTKINVLGAHHFKNRMSVFSFEILDPYGNKYNFRLIHRILNDIFGIQLRSGCHCAGPFGIEILGIDAEKLLHLENEFKKGNLIDKPGWLRFNLHYSFTDQDFDYLLFALRFSAENGRALELKFYEMNNDGSYSIKKNSGIKTVFTLHTFIDSLSLNLLEPYKVEEVEEEERNVSLEERKEQALKMISG